MRRALSVPTPNALDPMGGERARRARLYPGHREPITDPTDPRYGTVEPTLRRAEPQRETVGARRSSVNRS
jgi:hypothetical protein